MGKIKNTKSANPKANRITETNSDMCVVSLEKVISCKKHGLCLNEKHSSYKQQTTCKYNTELIKLFLFLSQKNWNELVGMRRQQEYGHEILEITHITAGSIKTYLASLGKKHINIFRFGSQMFRACGYREKNVFYLVCIDYDFSLYKHE